jgi:hypothetical protein
LENKNGSKIQFTALKKLLVFFHNLFLRDILDCNVLFAKPQVFLEVFEGPILHLFFAQL